VQEADYGHRWLLRARRERPRCGTANRFDEIASSHCLSDHAKISPHLGSIKTGKGGERNGGKCGNVRCNSPKPLMSQLGRCCRKRLENFAEQ
jgi:hypothetical protein